MSNFRITYEELIECPNCEKGKSFLKLFDTIEDTLTRELNACPLIPKKFPIVRNSRVKCSFCDLIFMSPRLSDESLSIIYEHWYQYAYKDIFTNEQLISQRKREFEKYHLNIIERHTNHKGNLLDIGCGSGLFMSLAREKGWAVYGVELDEFAAKKARDGYNLPVYCGSLQELRIEEKIDVVTLFDYLEHTKNPKKDLCLVRNMLSKNGVVFIRVPNQKSLQSLYMKEKWVGYISNHLFYFDKKTIINMIESCGFKLKYFYCGNYCSQLDIIVNNFNYALRKISNKKNQNDAQKNNNQTPCENQRKILAEKNSYKLSSYINAFFMQELDFLGGLLNKGNNLMLIAEKI